jgi:hypothetical protein
MIFRFNFADEFADELYSFSKINQYLDRKEFKEKWEEWVADHSEKIDMETRRLESLGYEGDVIVKMFKSARYYFRTKTTSEPKQRRQYLPQDKTILQEIDEFICNDMKNPDFKPRTSFLKWCEGESSRIEMKKTFKNRYYLLKTK